MPNLQEMKKMFLKSIRTFKSIPLLVTLVNAHLHIFFFQQVRQIKSQTFNRCIVDIRAHSVISLLCYNLQQSVKNKRGIF